jgi:hypothetical protein
MPERKSMPAAEAVKSFAKSDITVSVVKTGKGGEPQRDPQNNRILTEVKPLAAGHILAAMEDGETVSITTIDGRKYSAPKAGK